MVITHHGGQCFKVAFGDITLAFDPIGKGGSLPAVRFGADIALVSRSHTDMNGIDQVQNSDKNTFVINGPGEYEKSGVTVQGFLTKSEYALPKGVGNVTNTIYSVKLEGMTIVHLGALSDTTLPHDAKESIEEIDVLFIPVGGDGVLSASEASALATFLEPKVIIPMHWSGMGEAKSLEAFIKEQGGGEERVDKLTLKKKDVNEKDGAIIIVTP
jgi:L-ascorbate metabolism protein UlaG (beta-lactamase superfamily)